MRSGVVEKCISSNAILYLATA